MYRIETNDVFDSIYKIEESVNEEKNQPFK